MKNQTKTSALGKPFIDAAELPHSYNVTRLTLLARDPNRIHAYWEIASGDLEELQNRVRFEDESPQMVLRIYDVTCVNFNGYNANHWFDLDVGYSSRDWYLDLWQDNANYLGEIGLRLYNGKFFPLARSNVAALPRKTFSSRDELVWMEQGEADDARAYVYGQSRKSGKILTSSQKKARRRFYLTEDDIRAYYMNLFPLFSKLRRRGRRGRRVPSLKDVLLSKGKGYTFEKTAGSGRSEDLIQKILLGASAEMVLKHGAGGSESFASQSLGASDQLFRQRKFFFEIGTELIVYGRTEADAKVTLNGKDVRLNPDGTFRLHYMLPDDHQIPLDFKAFSSDGEEERQAETRADRVRTRYAQIYLKGK